MNLLFTVAIYFLLAIPASASKNDDLLMAARSGNLEAVKALIAKGANVNAKNPDSGTPLYQAVLGGSAEVAAFLMQNGADVRTERNAGITLLHVAAAHSSSDTVKLLLDAGLPLEGKAADGQTPLCHAARHGAQTPVVAFLISRGADVTAGGYNHPLQNAVMASSVENAAILLDHGVDPKRAPYLFLIAGSADPDTSLQMIKLLIAKGADVTMASGYGDTALHQSARDNRAAPARLLLAAGADADRRNSNGETPRSLFKGSHGVDIDTLLPFTVQVNRFVQSRLDAWLKKDEYESAADYAARMKGKRAKVGELMGEAFDHFAIWKSVTVGLYDAESETFKLTISEIGNIIVPVPKPRARDFKEKFASFAFKPQFADAGKGWTLSRLEMRASDGGVFVYDSSKQANYRPVVFDVKTGAAVDTALAGGKEIKSEVRKVVVAAAEDVGLVPKFGGPARELDVAVVIGIETYRGLPKSAYSRVDAELVKRYLLALGFKERNIALLTDDKATYIDIKKTLETWLRNVAKPESSVFVYYSGHGAPEPASGEGYIVPYDGDPEYLQDTAYPLKKLVAGLNGLGAKQAVLILDSCFSGMGGRSVLAKNARPLVAKTAGPVLMNGVAMMTASGNDQISTSSEEFGHGVFTYYFLKALKDGKKDLSDIYGYALPLVEDEARRQNARQTPTMSPSADKAKGRFALVR